VIAAPCTAAATIALVNAFVRDYNGKRPVAAATRFAPEPAFQWFSAPDRLAGRAYDRATLVAYFHRRHAPLHVVRIRAGYDPARDIVDFSGKLAANKDFKGAATCTPHGPSLIVWSM
jgi:hypothetical protein